MPQTKHIDINNSTRFVLYRYRPSLPAATIFIILFALTTLYHIFQISRKRTWYFIPLVIGGAMEAVGYTGRAQSHFDQWKRSAFVMQSLLLLIAPALFAASIYIILGRVILLTDGDKYSLIRQKWLTKVFVAGDVLSLLVQGAGGGIMATYNGMETGEKIVITGLFIQIIFFAFFVTVAGCFHVKWQRHGLATGTMNLKALPWRRHMVILYTASGLILVRSIFRAIEYLGGNSGYLLKHEVFLYVFDSVLMLAVMIGFNVVHPSEVTQLHQQRLIQRASEVEMKPNDGRKVRIEPWP